MNFIKNILRYIEKNTIKFINLSFRSKLVISFIIFSVIPLLLIQTFSYYNITLSLKKKAEDLTNFNLIQSAKNLNTYLSTYTDILYQVYIDDKIIEMVKKINKGSTDDRAVAFNVVSERLKSIVAAKEGIRSISILCPSNYIVCYDSLTGSSIENIWMNYEDIRKTDIYIQAINSNRMILIPTAFVEKNRGKDYYLFHIAKKMHDFGNVDMEGIGVAVISIDESSIFKACNQVDKLNAGKSAESINFVIDKEGNIVSFPEKNFIGVNIDSFKDNKSGGDDNSKFYKLLNESLIFNGRPSIINQFYDEGTEWTIVNAVDRSYLFSDVYRLQYTTVMFCAIAILLSILFIIYITRNFSSSIGKILKAMKTVQDGELSVQVELDNNDEISTIASRFNKMMSRINMLVEEVKQVTSKQKEAEIKALEAQINPHFLYNTLDSINWIAIEKEEFEISRLLSNLAQILRYSIGKSNEIVKIREEIQWLEQYVYLQQYRFNYSFTCNIDFDEQVLDCKINKLLLQPFIENCLVHGFAGINSGGILKISGQFYKDAYIRITIEDNGRGIKEDILEALTHDNARAVKTEGTGLGVRNAFDRMRIYYGDSAGWSISSTPDKGTTVVLTIPRAC